MDYLWRINTETLMKEEEQLKKETTILDG